MGARVRPRGALSRAQPLAGHGASGRSLSLSQTCTCQRRTTGTWQHGQGPEPAENRGPSVDRPIAGTQRVVDTGDLQTPTKGACFSEA